MMTSLVGMLCIVLIGNAYGSCNEIKNCDVAYVSAENSPIVISKDPSSPKVNIVIYAPDFNANPYAIDTIGEDGSSIMISTREASIHYRLVETGSDTGYFSGYVILSSVTSTCSPICGPTDGFLAGEGDDAITVSFTYSDGHTISKSYGREGSISNYNTIPEFPYAEFGLFACMVYLILVFKANLIR